MKTEKEIFKWLRANLGRRCLGVLTSTDAQALTASVALCPLIGYPSAPPDLFAAYRAIILVMQPNARWLAYHSIAMELDWGHRDMIWIASGLPEGDKPAYECSFGPGGSCQDLSKVDL